MNPADMTTREWAKERSKRATEKRKRESAKARGLEPLRFYLRKQDAALLRETAERSGKPLSAIGRAVVEVGIAELVRRKRG